MFNFGQQPNDKTCSCGRHAGVGDWTPEQRAAFYKRLTTKMPLVGKTHQSEFVKDWEAHHGTIQLTMGAVVKNTGSIRREDKDKDVTGPIFIENTQPSMF